MLCFVMNALKITIMLDRLPGLVLPAIGAAVGSGVGTVLSRYVTIAPDGTIAAFLGTLFALVFAHIGGKYGYGLGWWLERFDKS